MTAARRDGRETVAASDTSVAAPRDTALVDPARVEIAPAITAPAITLSAITLSEGVPWAR